jgi:hypothetical protein
MSSLQGDFIIEMDDDLTAAPGAGLGDLRGPSSFGAVAGFLKKALSFGWLLSFFFFSSSILCFSSSLRRFSSSLAFFSFSF